MDVPLTDLGRRQAREAAHSLARAGVRRPIRLFSSDQSRSVETAAIVADALRVEPVFSPLLREQALGTLEGRLIRELSPEPVPDDADISEVAWGGGETIEQVWRRAALFTDRHLLNHSEGDVVVVTHGTLLQVFVSYLDGRGHREVDWDFVPRNGEITTRPVPPSAGTPR